jgi:hypothetical protein
VSPSSAPRADKAGGADAATVLRRRRAAAQALDGSGPRDPAGLVARLLAVQAQDLNAARLALRARSAGLDAAEVDRALADRSLVVGWLMRGTLHLVAAEDFGWLLGLTAPTRIAASARRLRQLGIGPDDGDRAVATIERALAGEGPLTRPELAERLAAACLPTEGQATPHLLMLAALRGVAVLGPVRPDGVQAFALAADWLGRAPHTALAGEQRDRALAELARRYLAAHGPATDADLAAWSGLPLRDARAGLAAVAPPDDAEAPPIAPRLLPALDPYMLGWMDRSFAVAPEHARRVHPGGGVVRAVATVDGQVVGTWARRATRVTLDLFTTIATSDRRALDAEADAVSRFRRSIARA